MKVGLSTKEKAKKYVKSRRIGIIDHIACVPRVISLRKGRIADCLVGDKDSSQDGDASLISVSAIGCHRVARGLVFIAH